MTNENPAPGGQDGHRINIVDDADLENWARHFGVKEDTLRDAIRRVGSRVVDVERVLKEYLRT